MYGPRLAGVLTAVAVGPILIGFLLLWTWTIFRKHHQDRSQDLEATKLPPAGRFNCSLRKRVLRDPPYHEEIKRAIGTLNGHLNIIATHCQLESKTPQAIPLSRLRSHLHELGDGEHRLPAERLLELLPGHVFPFVRHILVTTVIEAITVNEKPHLTILDNAPVALLTEILSHGDPDGRLRLFHHWKLLLIVWHRSNAEDRYRSPTRVHGIPASLRDVEPEGNGSPDRSVD